VSSVPASRTLDENPELSAALADEVSRLEAAALDLLRDLIRTPSVSGDEGDHRDQSSVAGKLWTSLATLPGVERDADTISPGRDNVMAIIPSDPGTIFVLDAHTDTVPPGDPTAWLNGGPYAATDGEVRWLGDDHVRLNVQGETIERRVRRRLGRLWEARSFDRASVVYGRGAFDNKGPVVVAWLATAALAAALARRNLELTGTLVTAFVVDEEQAMAGTRALVSGSNNWLARHGLLPDNRRPDGMRDSITGVALDGSYGFVPIVGHRGVAQLAIRATGQAAHAATPDLGVNAVTRLATVLHTLETERAALADRLAGLFADKLLEPATLAIGTTIAGGGVTGVETVDSQLVVRRTAINVVPDWCEATIDCRHPRAANGDDTNIRQRIADTVAAFIQDRTGLAAPDLRVEVVSGNPPCAILDRPEGAAADRLVSAVLRHGESVSGFVPWVETAPGGTDATVMINEAGIHTMVEFGPAGAFAHEPFEYVETDQIAIGALILARTIVDVLGVTQARA
jgi:acetylornithine deacetylase/succinyl-diaminopimelate desuccinylase-like protein